MQIESERLKEENCRDVQSHFESHARDSISRSVSWSVGWSVGLSVCRSVAEGSEHATFCYFVHCMILFSVSTLLFGFMDFF